MTKKKEVPAPPRSKNAKKQMTAVIVHFSDGTRESFDVGNGEGTAMLHSRPTGGEQEEREISLYLSGPGRELVILVDQLRAQHPILFRQANPLEMLDRLLAGAIASEKCKSGCACRPTKKAAAPKAAKARR